MATWFTITFEGEPTERDFERVAELAAEGFTSGQLINDEEDYEREGPATGWHLAPGDGPPRLMPHQQQRVNAGLPPGPASQYPPPLAPWH